MIARLDLKTVEARRFTKAFENPPAGTQVRIDHNSTVTLMHEAGPDEAYVEFAYTTSYGPIGVVKVDGALVYKGPDAHAAAVQWKESRRMPNETASKIHTAVMHACVPEAVALAKLLRLPPPIPLPQVQFKKEGTAAASTPAGPEFA